jgi:hypothetical protein
MHEPSKLIKLLVFGWFMFPLPGGLIAIWLRRGRSALENSMRCYVMLGAAVVIAALVWLAVLWLLAPSLVRDSPLKGWLVTAGLVGLVSGPLMLGRCNSLIDASEVQSVGVRFLGFAGVHAEFEITSGPQKGLVMHCAKRHWNSAQADYAPFVLHRGWFGLWWGEFPQS